MIRIAPRPVPDPVSAVSHAATLRPLAKASRADLTLPERSALERLYDLRTSIGWSRERAALELGVSPRQWARWESYSAHCQVPAWVGIELEARAKAIGRRVA